METVRKIPSTILLPLAGVSYAELCYDVPTQHKAHQQDPCPDSHYDRPPPHSREHHSALHNANSGHEGG